MKKTLKRLPVLLVIACTLFAASCSDIEVEPVGTEDDETPIVLPPPKPKQQSTALDSLSIG